MHNLRRGFLVALTTASIVAAPIAAGALSVADLQAQVQVLLGQIAQLNGSAQVQNSSATVAPLPSNYRVCSVLYRNMSQGMRGDDVKGLQEFLSGEGYLSANATGFFGPMTAAAVAKWQVSQGVSAVGSAGPQTRAAIMRHCGGPQICPMYMQAPYTCRDGSQSQPDPSDQCHNRQYCPVGSGVSGNRPPVISGFSGPTTLAVNAVGTWTINALDPENGSLSYLIWWGDEGGVSGAMASDVPLPNSFVQTTTFTHAYAKVGLYTVMIFARDSAGQEAKTSTTVQVGGGAVACTMEYAPVCGQWSGYCGPNAKCDYSPKTYSNRCMMNAAGASFLYQGQCSNAL